MAAFQRGLDARETADLTDIMLHSGAVIDLGHIPGRKVDKHSTGGVGDKVSLILAPMVAACGVPVPMISGRGLGHTGGTLDKLESIPGFRTGLSIEEYRAVIADTGLVLAGQTADVAPADRKLYALRDVTATVESIPLIAGSIMSKKLAEGIDALVLDVKTGNGAFMRSPEDSLALARALVDIGLRAGKETIGFVTGMDQPLGLAVGNWLEVAECVECLRGRSIPDLMEVTLVLGGAMVMLGGKAASVDDGMRLCRDALWSGRAYEKFLEVVRRQGGNTARLEALERAPRATMVRDVMAESSGVISGMETFRLGMLAIALGAGRTRMEDSVDPLAGIVFRKKVGDRVERGEILAEIHTNVAAGIDDRMGECRSAIVITPQADPPRPLIRSMVDRHGVHAWTTPVQH
jgi:pyrimidine-nucleoside phosphorylase